jgi:hypothetical protein
MLIVSDEDKYISTTWGAGIRLQAGVPKEVGEDLGLVCLQEGCRRVETIKEKRPSEPINKIEVEVKEEVKPKTKKVVKKKTTTKKSK